jgi:hypothetical protein
MSFHVVYSRHYWDYEDGNGSFDNSWTIYRNVPYSELFTMKDAIPTLLENANKVYADYESKRGHKIDESQFIKSEVFICDDEDYYKTYQDVYGYHIGGTNPKEDYIHDYGQKHPFMLLKDFDQKQEATNVY